MVEFNKYSFYSMAGNASMEPTLDELDKHVAFFRECGDIDEAQKYIDEHFQKIRGEKWLSFDDLKKEVWISVNDEKVQFCALKNHQQYFGKGWIRVNGESL